MSEPPSLFDGDDTMEPTQAQVLSAYASLLIESPPVRCVDTTQVGAESALRAARELARKDVKRYQRAVELAKRLRRERRRAA